MESAMTTAQPSTGPRCIDVGINNATPLANAIEDLYEGSLDVLVVRGALPSAPLAGVADSFERGELAPAWTRPNAVMPAEDIQVLGTAATPTYSSPQGPSLDAYLGNAGWYGTAPLFGDTFDPTAEIGRALSRFSGGRPVKILQSVDRRSFAPFTVRRLTHGKGIGLHHDLHLSLRMFEDVAPQLDTRTLISYVFTLQGPEAGGELVVYNLSPATPDPPKMPNGFSWDLSAVEARFGSEKIATRAGDLFLFASARCLHRVAPVAGSRARVTMGGFLALNKGRSDVLYWS
jgi:hapalindole-type alkaloid chlorinase